MRLDEIYDKIGKMKIVIDLFGQTYEFRKEFVERLANLGRIIATEKNLLKVSDARNLPPKTPLGPKAKSCFAELEKWFHAKVAPPEEKEG